MGLLAVRPQHVVGWTHVLVEGGPDIRSPRGTGFLYADIKMVTWKAGCDGSQRTNQPQTRKVGEAEYWKTALSLGTGALLCYEATASAFRAVTLHNWKWLLLRSMVCKLREGCEETVVYIETGEALPLLILALGLLSSCAPDTQD